MEPIVFDLSLRATRRAARSALPDAPVAPHRGERGLLHRLRRLLGRRP